MNWINHLLPLSSTMKQQPFWQHVHPLQNYEFWATNHSLPCMWFGWLPWTWNQHSPIEPVHCCCHCHNWCCHCYGPYCCCCFCCCFSVVVVIAIVNVVHVLVGFKIGQENFVTLCIGFILKCSTFLCLSKRAPKKAVDRTIWKSKTDILLPIRHSYIFHLHQHEDLLTSLPTHKHKIWFNCNWDQHSCCQEKANDVNNDSQPKRVNKRKASVPAKQCGCGQGCILEQKDSFICCSNINVDNFLFVCFFESGGRERRRESGQRVCKVFVQKKEWKIGVAKQRNNAVKLAKAWKIGLPLDKKTQEVTTQKAVREYDGKTGNAEHQGRTGNRHLRYKHLGHVVYTNTFYRKYTSVHGTTASTKASTTTTFTTAQVPHLGKLLSANIILSPSLLSIDMIPYCQHLISLGGLSPFSLLLNHF